MWKVASGSGILESRVMTRSLHVASATQRIVGAWVCLIAVLLLWTPMWASAWMAQGTACCAGNMCAAHGHGKMNSPAKSDATKNGIECEHSPSAGMACSLSSCHEDGASLVSSGVYLLPERVRISSPAETVSLAARVKHDEVRQVFAPPSPPPKNTLQ